MFWVLDNCVIAIGFALCLAIAIGEALESKAHLWMYAAISLSSVYAGTRQYRILIHVSFLAQTLVIDSVMLMPIMV